MSYMGNNDVERRKKERRRPARLRRQEAAVSEIQTDLPAARIRAQDLRDKIERMTKQADFIDAAIKDQMMRDAYGSK